jgi:hypothetical protein
MGNLSGAGSLERAKGPAFKEARALFGTVAIAQAPRHSMHRQL